MNAESVKAKLPRNPFVRLTRAVMALHVGDDMLSLVLSYFLAFKIRFPTTVHNVLMGNFAFDSAYARVYLERSYIYISLMAVVVLAFYSLLGMYDGHRRIRRTPLLWNAMVANGAAIAIVAVVLFFAKSRWHMRGFIPLVLLLNIPITVLVRMLTNKILTFMRRRHPSLRSRALLLGAGPDADIVMEWSSLGMLKGIYVVRRAEAPTTPEMARTLLPPLLNDDVDLVFIIDRTLDVDTTMECVRLCAERNKAVKVLFPRFITLHNPYWSGDMIDGIPIVHFSPPEFTDTDTAIRRFVSVSMAAISCLPLLPVMLLISIGVRIDSKGKAIFRQWRYGKDGRKFSMLKFRTMCDNAECMIAQLRERNEADGALFKMHDDPRVTRVGRVLRRTSLDELPQIFNIVRGEMRFVGPRPLPFEDLLGYIDSWHFMRQKCHPGISCIWQVSGRSDIGFEDMCILDAWYWLNSSWMMDVRIIIRTVWVVVFRRGAY